jgi:hypothetical protein
MLYARNPEPPVSVLPDHMRVSCVQLATATESDVGADGGVWSGTAVAVGFGVAVAGRGVLVRFGVAVAGSGVAVRVGVAATEHEVVRALAPALTADSFPALSTDDTV